ncbi:YfcC family protein [Salinicoccus sesuvii]|uniref:YfcC family protein n=1 Tax=Salinicoccus sesuvii TaxID=868281 RepID=A0ABV7N406_9STAP
MDRGETNEETESRFRFPHTYAILLAVVIIAAALSYVIPAGEFERVEIENRTEVVPGSYTNVEQNPVSFFELFKSIPTGLIAGANIIFYIFLVGGAFGIIRATGAIEAVIQQVMISVKGREKLMIPVIMLVFSILGFTTGMSEEAIIFVPIGIVLATALGYDAIVGTAMVTLGAAAGFIGGMLNPFTVGIAQQIAELRLFSGWGFRSIVYLVVLGTGIVYVMRYAKKVQKDPKSSLVYEESKKGMINFTEDVMDFEKLKKRHVLILVTFAIGIIVNVYGIFRYEWYLTELSANFFLVGLVAGLIGRMKINDIFDAFIDGMKLVVYGAIIVGFARAIVVVLESGLIIDSVINGMSSVLDFLPASITALGMLVIQVVINFFVPSGSGQAMTTMPIMTPIADLQNIPRQVAVLAYQYGDGITNTIIPTSASLMGVLAVSGIPYIKWVQFVWKVTLLWLLIAAVALVVATVIGIS